MRLEGARLDKDRSEYQSSHQASHQASSSDFNLIPSVVLMKGASDSTFVISFRSQKKIVTALAWKSAAMVCGGTVSMLFGLYVLWARIALL